MWNNNFFFFSDCQPHTLMSTLLSSSTNWTLHWKVYFFWQFKTLYFFFEKFLTMKITISCFKEEEVPNWPLHQQLNTSTSSSICTFFIVENKSWKTFKNRNEKERKKNVAQLKDKQQEETHPQQKKMNVSSCKRKNYYLSF